MINEIFLRILEFSDRVLLIAKLLAASSGQYVGARIDWTK